MDGKTDRIAVANVGYARVSTTDQDPALQHDALAAAKCVKVFDDCASGARGDRVGLQAALNYVREGDVLIVWKLDRLGRSLPHLIETVTSLAKRGVGFRSSPRRSTQLPQVDAWSSTCSELWGSSNVTSFRSAPAPV